MSLRTLISTVAAGFLGGILSHYIWAPAVQAQAQTPKEIRAQSFVLEDADGRTLGTWSVEPPRPGSLARGTRGAIRLFDDRGREVWRVPMRGIIPATGLRRF